MKTLILLSTLVLWSGSAMAAGYKEVKSGDLSNDGLAPTPIVLKPGANIVDGKFGSTIKRGVVRTDRDYFSFTVAAGQTLDAIRLDPKTDVGGAVSFIGIQAGPQVTVPPDGVSAEDLLGWVHFGSGDEGRDLLPAIGAGTGAIGFTPPLGPGTYSVWVQELSVCACKYRFLFDLSAATVGQP